MTAERERRLEPGLRRREQPGAPDAVRRLGRRLRPGPRGLRLHLPGADRGAGGAACARARPADPRCRRRHRHPRRRSCMRWATTGWSRSTCPTACSRSRGARASIGAQEPDARPAARLRRRQLRRRDLGGRADRRPRPAREPRRAGARDAAGRPRHLHAERAGLRGRRLQGRSSTRSRPAGRWQAVDVDPPLAGAAECARRARPRLARLCLPGARREVRHEPAPIDFYFEFASPYGYLASTQIDAIGARHGREVAWHPIMLGAAFKETGARPLMQTPLKGPYLRHDVPRFARLLGVPFTASRR